MNSGAPAVAHGVGLFETMRAVDGRLQYPSRHFRRLEASSAALGFAPPHASRFREVTERAASGLEKGGERMVRCLYLAVRTALDDPESWVLSADEYPIPAATLSRRVHGRAIVLPPSWRRALPEHKMTSYAVCTLGLRRALGAGADEALFVDDGGCVLEGTATNVFAVSGSTLVTAPVEAGILPGVVRGLVLEAAAALGLEIEQRAPDVGELRRGAFLTGSLTTIAPLRTIDMVPCADPGPLLETIRARIEADTDRTNR